MFRIASSLPLVLAASSAVAQSFVTVEGEHFHVDGEDFVFAGSNAYYWPLRHVGLPSSILQVSYDLG